MLFTHHADRTKCISGAQTSLQAGPEFGDVQITLLSLASNDVNVRDRQIRTLPPVVRVI